MDQLDPLDDELDDPPPDRPLTPNEQKLQRWVDLLAALLIRQRHATFDDLAKDVPGYDLANGKPESLKRTFERDKDELRRFGVPITTVEDGEGEIVGYRLERKAFYLPYLMLAGQARSANGRRTGSHEGYRTLETLAFEPEELDAIVDAAARVRALGDPVLAGEADAAIRKLALDLPLGAAFGGTSPTVVPPRSVPDLSVFERLSDALARRKTVTVDYFSMERGDRSRRSIEPYGLFFVSSHWYLAGRDAERDALRNFRLSRISHVAVNKQRSQSADYEVPADFSLRDHARSREPWEIGDGDATPVLVEFVADTGATQAALALGAPVDGRDDRRRFEVRRPDAFARWLLSFGGDACPVEPAAIVAEYERVAAATLARYTSHGERSVTA
jgi:proteasome accessory factor B